MSDIPTFDQIQEALHLVRKKSGLSADVVETVIAPALRHYSDFHHPSDPNVLADVFWDTDAVCGFQNAQEVVESVVSLKPTGAVVAVEIRRAVELPAMWALVRVDQWNGHNAQFYRSEETVNARIAALPGSAA